MRRTPRMVAAGSVALASILLGGVCHALSPSLRKRVRDRGAVVATAVRAAHDQLRFARAMVAWRGLAAVPHVRALAPEMLAQIRDEAARAQSGHA